MRIIKMIYLLNKYKAILNRFAIALKRLLIFSLKKSLSSFTIF